MGQDQIEKSVLVMDDEDLVCEIADQILEFLGFTTQITKDGLEALNLYNEKFEQGTPYGAVIMDLNIPGGVGGKDAVQDILAVDPNARVIVASGDAENPIMVNPQEYGFVGCLAKPFEIGAMETLLKSLVD